MMADDHAAKAISSYSGGLNDTPNIDGIAHDGVTLTTVMLQIQFVHLDCKEDPLEFLMCIQIQSVKILLKI